MREEIFIFNVSWLFSPLWLVTYFARHVNCIFFFQINSFIKVIVIILLNFLSISNFFVFLSFCIGITYDENPQCSSRNYWLVGRKHSNDWVKSVFNRRVHEPTPIMPLWKILSNFALLEEYLVSSFVEKKTQNN